MKILGLGRWEPASLTEAPLVLGSGGVGGIVANLEGSGGRHHCHFVYNFIYYANTNYIIYILS